MLLRHTDSTVLIAALCCLDSTIMLTALCRKCQHSAVSRTVLAGQHRYVDNTVPRGPCRQHSTALTLCSTCAVESDNKKYHRCLRKEGAAQHLRSCAEFTGEASQCSGRLSDGIRPDVWGVRFFGLLHASMQVPLPRTDHCQLSHVDVFELGKWVTVPLEFLDSTKVSAGTKLWELKEHLGRASTKVFVMPSIRCVLEMVEKYAGEDRIRTDKQLKGLFWAELEDAPSWGQQYVSVFEQTEAELKESGEHTFDTIMDAFMSFHMLVPITDDLERDRWLARLEQGSLGQDGKRVNGATVCWDVVRGQTSQPVMGCLCPDFELRAVCTHTVGWLVKHGMIELPEQFELQNLMPPLRGGSGRPAAWSKSTHAQHSAHTIAKNAVCAPVQRKHCTD